MTDGPLAITAATTPKRKASTPRTEAAAGKPAAASPLRADASLASNDGKHADPAPARLLRLLFGRRKAGRFAMFAIVLPACLCISQAAARPEAAALSTVVVHNLSGQHTLTGARGAFQPAGGRRAAPDIAAGSAADRPSLAPVVIELRGGDGVTFAGVCETWAAGNIRTRHELGGTTPRRFEFRAAGIECRIEKTAGEGPLTVLLRKGTQLRSVTRISGTGAVSISAQ